MIIADMIKGCRLVESMHFHGKGTFGYRYRVVEFPRLQRQDTYVRKTRATEITWLVDGEPVGSFEAAVAALNKDPIVTDAECAALRPFDDVYTEASFALARADFSMSFALQAKGLIALKDRKARRTDLGRRFALGLADSDFCSHAGSEADPKVCVRCGIHVDEFRPPEDDL